MNKYIPSDEAWLLLVDKPRVGWLSLPMLKLIPVGADLLSAKNKILGFRLHKRKKMEFIKRGLHEDSKKKKI